MTAPLPNPEIWSIKGMGVSVPGLGGNIRRR
jgi:hypothetical protein